jgi:molybdate transport system ATP-binding protein
MGNKPLISITDGSIRFDGTTLFEEITINIGKGEIVVVTGNSNSGKSVFLKIIAGNMPLSKGAISYNFTRAGIQNNSEELSIIRNIAYLDVRHSFKDRQNLQKHFYQQRYNSSFSEDSITTMEYITDAFNKSPRQGFWNIHNTIEHLELQPLLDKNLIKLSNGESRRVRIAQLLVKNPVVMLLDQPFTGIDQHNKQIITTLFDKIKESGITLIASCNTSEVPQNADTIIELKRGTTARITDLENYLPEIVNNNNELTHQQVSFIKSLPNHSKYEWIVRMDNVTIRYGNTNIINNITWGIKQEEHWALSGANGSGKSTLLSLITGDNPQAYSNNIILFDKKRGTGESIWDIKSKIGFVSPELFQFFPGNMTCRDAVGSGFTDFLIKPRNLTNQQRESIEKWMNLLKITEYGEIMLRRLPVTVQRLTLLARALVKNPPLLVLDEPCQGFDHQQQQNFKNIIDQLSIHKNITWIYVTHNHDQLPLTVTNKICINPQGMAEISSI